MINRLKYFVIWAIVGTVVWGGSGFYNRVEGRSTSQSNNPGDLAEFIYLPLVSHNPLVWFLKEPESPRYLQNYANNAGCNWLGIAGEVFDLQLDPVPLGAYRVHVWESGVDNRVSVGGAPAYGPSGYEQFLFDSPRVSDHNLQLETADGEIVSPVYSVQTHASCSENLLYFIFLQDT